MTFDWRNVMVLADELSNRKDETALRSAISRAYYSALCYARDRAELNSQGLRDSHRMVFEFYRNRADAKLRDYGNNVLPGLQRKRKEADYEEEAQINSAQTKYVVARAKQVIAYLENLKKEQIDKQR